LGAAVKRLLKRMFPSYAWRMNEKYMFWSVVWATWPRNVVDGGLLWSAK